MSCPDGRHRFPQGGFICSMCGDKGSALVQGGALPYSTWSLVNTTAISERAGSLLFAATDSRDGTGYHISECFPASGRNTEAYKRRFVVAAKALSNAPMSTMRMLFPYTLHGLCYAVSAPPGGVYLGALQRPGHVSEADATRCLESMLRALVDLHGTMGSEGPLFIGGFELGDVVVQGDSLSGIFEVRNSLYLENILAESPLSPEQAMNLDVRSAGEVALALVAGDVSAALQKVVVSSQLRDTVFGTALEYILHPANDQRPSAKYALHHLELLRKAQGSGAPGDWKAAFAVSGAARLKELAHPKAVFVPQTAASASAAAAAPPPPAVRQPSGNPIRGGARQVWTPVGSPTAAGASDARTTPVPLRRKSGMTAVRGCLLTILLGFGLLTLILVRACAPSPQPVERSIVFGVGPNPVIRGHQATLTWAAAGYNSVRINDVAKPLRGSETFLARKTITYRLVATGDNGHFERRQVTLTVQNARAADRPSTPLSPNSGPVASDTPEALRWKTILAPN